MDGLGEVGQGVCSRIPFSGMLAASREQEVALMCKPYYVPGAAVVRKPAFPQVWSPDLQTACPTCRFSGPPWERMAGKAWGRPGDYPHGPPRPT